MNLIHKYYGSILWLIRYLGIGVGNEDSKATLFFTGVFLALIATILKVISLDIRVFGNWILILIPVTVFILLYIYFSRDTLKAKILDWLDGQTKSQRLRNTFISLLFSLLSIIFFIKIYV